LLPSRNTYNGIAFNEMALEYSKHILQSGTGFLITGLILFIVALYGEERP
jgi:hypothetical protein